jgi:hypothetical protein
MERQNFSNALTRRHFLGGASLSLGTLALSSLLSGSARAQGSPAHGGRAVEPRPVRSQAEAERARRPADARQSFTKGERFAFIKGTPKLLGSPYQFARHGQSGAQVSELLPHFARIVDASRSCARCARRSSTTRPRSSSCTPAMRVSAGRVSARGRVLWARPREPRTCRPSSCSLRRQFQPERRRCLWSSGFLPGEHQGVQLRSPGNEPVFRSSRIPRACRASCGGASSTRCGELQARTRRTCGDPGDRGAHRAVRTRLPHAVQRARADRPRERPPETLELYGAEPGEPSFANNCLLARRSSSAACASCSSTTGAGTPRHGEGDDLSRSCRRSCRRPTARAPPR